MIVCSEIERDIRRYDIEYVLTLLKTISRKSRVNAIDIAKAIADTVRYKGISTSIDNYMLSIQILYNISYTTFLFLYI